MEEKIIFNSDNGEEIEFFVLEQTKINGNNYLLVTDSNEDEAECFILEDVSKDDSQEAVYEFVEDNATLEALSKIFEELLDDVDIV